MPDPGHIHRLPACGSVRSKLYRARDPRQRSGPRIPDLRRRERPLRALRACGASGTAHGTTQPRKGLIAKED